VNQTPTVHLIDDDESFLRSMARRLRSHGLNVATWNSAAEFLLRPDQDAPGCVLTDLQMPARDGFELQRNLAASSNPLPLIFISGKGDIPSTVRAMRAGAEDFLTKRTETAELLAAIHRALDRDAQERISRGQQNASRELIDSLSGRELQMLLGIIQGLSNRQMSENYGVAERTVKHYRTLLTRRLDIYTSVDLCRLVQEAGLTPDDIAAAIDSTPATALQ
jgi:FixJ family two-component response regulator